MNDKRQIIIWVSAFVLFNIISLSVSAQSFQTDFDVLKEENWELWGYHSIWNAEKGYLKGRIQSPMERNIEMFQFKDLSGKYKRIDITAHGETIQREINRPGYETFSITLKDLVSRRGDFGVALGRVFVDPPKEYLLFYMFFTNRVEAGRFNGWNGLSSFPRWQIPRHPATRWDTQELASMELHFDRGHFQWFADDERRADFRDPDFSSIEIIGFVLLGGEIHVGSGRVDSFTISSIGLSVSSQAKLATTWSQLKRH